MWLDRHGVGCFGCAARSRVVPAGAGRRRRGSRGPRPSTPVSTSAGAAGAKCGPGARRCGGPEAAARRPIRRGTRSRHVCSPPLFDAWPLVRDPAGDLEFVALHRPTLRPLQTPPQPAGSAGARPSPATATLRSPARQPDRTAPRSTDRPRTPGPGPPAPTPPARSPPARRPAWAGDRWPGTAAGPQHGLPPAHASTAVRSRHPPPPPARSPHSTRPSQTTPQPEHDAPPPTAASHRHDHHTRRTYEKISKRKANVGRRHGLSSV